MTNALYSALKKITFKDVMKGKLEKETIEVVVTNDDGSPVLNEKNEPVKRTVSRVKPQDCYMIYGEARDYETGETQYGPWTAYKGAFKAVRIHDGAEFRSTTAIFPAMAGDIALDTYLRVKQDDPTAIVDFAFVIGVDPDERGAQGYKYVIKPVNAGEEAHNPFARLESFLAPKFAGLPGLTEAAAKTLGLMAPETAKQIEAPKGDETKGKAKADA